MAERSKLFESLSCHHDVIYELNGAEVLNAVVSWLWSCTGSLPVGSLPEVSQCVLSHNTALPYQQNMEIERR